MSALQWLGSIAGLWFAYVLYRWRRDVIHQRRVRARDLGHKAAGKLPRYDPPLRRIALIVLWLAAVGLLVPKLPAWVLLAAPPVLWQLTAASESRKLSRARYAAALRRNRLLLLAAPGSPRLLCRRADILLASGRVSEAVECAMKALAQGYTEGHQVRSMECLGKALTVQKRYEEGARAINTALKVMPRRSRLHAALAETLLWQAARPEEALNVLTRAFDYESKTRHKTGRNTFALIWADQAWARGLLGQRDVMLEDVRRALESADESEPSQIAGVHYRLGRALRAGGEEDSALQSFEDARATDPDGIYGQLASEAMAKAGA